MSRIQPKSLPEHEKKALLNALWSMITVLQSKEEIENFFRDLLSETEAIMLARRIAIAQLLLKGNTYDAIAEKLGAGNGTIAGVHRWLQSGKDGYQKLVPELEKELLKQEKYQNKQKKQKERYTFEWLKKKYPLHFFILNMMDMKDVPKVNKKIRKKR